MADLRLLSENAPVAGHVVFIHGLRRLGHNVWMSSGNPQELWPLWVASDIDNVAVWSVEYSSAPTRWRGHSMARADRAANVLALLLTEDRLKTGDLAFVTHSFGGLVFQHMVRRCHERAPNEPDVAQFLNRISRVTFLGTPHRGADLATWGGRLGLIFRPSAAADGLPRNDPDLRDLNQFYRSFAPQKQIDTQCLVETRPVRYFGMIVKPDSADVGLPSPPIPVDADHFGIAAPLSRNDEVYLHVLNQLRQPASRRMTIIASQESLDDISRNTGESAAALARIEQSLAVVQSAASPFIDEAVAKRTTSLRRKRFFVGSDPIEEARLLARELIEGDLRGASHEQRSEALAWCARIMLGAPDRLPGHAILDELRKVRPTPILTIVEAFAESYESKTDAALQRLAKFDSNEARSAAIIIVSNAKPKRDALAWAAKARLSADNLSPDGKFFLLKEQFAAKAWADALSTASNLTDADYIETPALAYMAACSHLAQALPDELRPMVLHNLTFDAHPLPLADDNASLDHRRKAVELFEKASASASELGCMTASYDAADRALWLRLRDPSTTVAARVELEASMRNLTHSLRRLPLAMQFGLPIDFNAVEEEIDRQEALTDGNSTEAALARLAIAVTQHSPKDAADYISRHKDQLVKHLNPTYVASVQIQAFAQADRSDEAEKIVDELASGNTTSAFEIDRLRRILREVKSASPADSLIEQFESSNSLEDLTNLVSLLERSDDWPRLTNYGRELFDRTRDLRACTLLAKALFEEGDHGSVLQLLNQQPDLVSQSELLQSLRAWSFYYEGDIQAARNALAGLRRKRDKQSDRTLLVQLAMASGDWPSLLAFIQEEWDRRDDRMPEELLRAGQLGHQLASSRARDLIFEAASRAPDNANVLIGCYGVAINAGWEDEGTAVWLERAAAQSGEDGPVKRVSIRDIDDLNPGWQERETKTWDALKAGTIPIFVAARVLNRTLVDFFLTPAIANQQTADPRRRSAIYAYSGQRRPFRPEAKTIALDSTAILNLVLLQILDRTIAHFDKIVIPHSTLSWLFEENQRVEHHQPSMVVKAREIRALIESKQLLELERSENLDSSLVSEVGEDLAALLAEASATSADQPHRVVVRSAPIHRVSSLMEEEADLGRYGQYICSCTDVIAALAERGQLTQAEERRARAYLSLRERPWPAPVSLRAGAVLYLDQLTVSYLQHLRLLGKLHAAGFTAIIAPAELDLARRLTRFVELSSQVRSTIESVRHLLANGIDRGKVVLGPIGRARKDDDEITHPTMQILTAAALADVVVVDDRFLNQHSLITGDFGSRPVATTYDLLPLMLADPAELTEGLTLLRRAGLSFIPLQSSELIELLRSARVSENVLVETAELRSIRESMLVAQLSDGLQLPKELVWLDQLILCSLEAIRAQWTDGMTEEEAKARSDWILDVFDIRHWAHKYASMDLRIMTARYRSYVLALSMLNTNVATTTRTKYWRWFEVAVLEPIKEEDRESFEEIARQIRVVILEHSLDPNDGGRDDT